MSARKNGKAAGKTGGKAAKTAGKGAVTHVAIVLDRSGSMASCREETISGFNEQAGKIRAKAQETGAGDVFVTLVLFNDEVVFSRFAEPADRLEPLDRESYAPDRTTAMLDAVGFTLERFGKVVRDDGDTRYLVLVMSDGQENDSKTHTYESVAELIQKRRATGRWTFSYMGANQDLGVIAERMSIPRSNIAAYSADSEGTARSFRSASRSMMGFMGRSILGMPVEQGFFRGKDEIGSVEDDEDDGKADGSPASRPN